GRNLRGAPRRQLVLLELIVGTKPLALARHLRRCFLRTSAPERDRVGWRLFRLYILWLGRCLRNPRFGIVRHRIFWPFVRQRNFVHRLHADRCSARVLRPEALAMPGENRRGHKSYY